MGRGGSAPTGLCSGSGHSGPGEPQLPGAASAAPPSRRLRAVGSRGRRSSCVPSAGLYGLPRRMGKLKDLSRFDASFFGVHSKQANTMDPQLRMLLEVTYEAIVDGGGSSGGGRGPCPEVLASLENSPSFCF